MRQWLIMERLRSLVKRIVKQLSLIGNMSRHSVARKRINRLEAAAFF